MNGTSRLQFRPATSLLNLTDLRLLGMRIHSNHTPDYEKTSDHSPSRAASVAMASVGTATLGSRWCGRKYAFATAVGITALPMTVATRWEYCDSVMMP